MTAPKLRVDTPDGPAILIGSLLLMLNARAKYWRDQEIEELRCEYHAEASRSRAKATVLEQLAKDVAEQR